MSAEEKSGQPDEARDAGELLDEIEAVVQERAEAQEIEQERYAKLCQLAAEAIQHPAPGMVRAACEAARLSRRPTLYEMARRGEQ